MAETIPTHSCLLIYLFMCGIWVPQDLSLQKVQEVMPGVTSMVAPGGGTAQGTP